MKIMVIASKNKSIFSFRGDLIKEFIKNGYDVVATGPNRDFVEDIESLGAKFIEVPLVKDNTNIKGDFQYFNKLRQVIKAEKPDKIFSYTIKPVIYGSIAGSVSGVKEIYPMITGLGRVYGGNSLKLKTVRLLTDILYKIAFKGCKKVIFQNWDDLELFVAKKYLPREKCEKVDGSGVNMERFAFTELPKKKMFLMISRVIKEKGVIEYCEAAKSVKEKYPDTRFIILGAYDNSVGAIKPEEINEYVNNGIIEYPGEIKDVSPILRDSYAYVLPTYYREGIPRTILEAMASGKPILTTDWVGTKEAVEDGKNGFLLPIKNSKALAEKMLYLIEHEEEAAAMGKSSYEICKKKFAVEIINKHMLDIMGIKESRDGLL